MAPRLIFIARDVGDFSLRGRELLRTLPVLIISSDPAHSDKAAEIVHEMDLQSVICSSLTDARSLIERQTFQFVLCDDDLPDCNLRTSLQVVSSPTSVLPFIALLHLASQNP